MRLLIYELFSSGASGDGGELALLGLAMFNAVVSDFAAIPGLNIVTIVADRLRSRVAAACSQENVAIRWTRNSGGAWPEYFAEALTLCDGALIIAPETDGILTRLTRLAEESGKVVLGSSSSATELAGNKYKLLKLLAAQGLSVPRTGLITRTARPWAAPVFRRLALPLVVKPAAGAGCQGVFLLERAEQLTAAGAWRTARPPMLVQEYIAGEAVSVSCLVTGGQALPVSVNQQLLRVNGQFHFAGITTPYSHPQAEAAKAVAKRACETVSGLAGFVGVDLVLGAAGPVIIEINPRITAAYIALREVLAGNLAHSLYQLCLQQSLPVLPAVLGSYTYIRD